MMRFQTELHMNKYLLPEVCEISKVVEISDEEFGQFSADLLRDRAFIRDNQDCMGCKDGVRRCLLVTCEGHDYGILVDSEGHDYARYSALLPEAKLFLEMQQISHDQGIDPQQESEMEMSL